MSIAPVASRFAVLPDDDEADWKAPKDKKAEKAKAKAAAEKAAKDTSKNKKNKSKVAINLD